jgi:uncharacterized protein (TIGR02679 family)
VLGTPELAWILDRARRKMERGEPLTGAIRLFTPTAPQCEAFRRLLGRGQLRGEALVVRLQEIDDLLQKAQLADGLAAAVVELTGPVSNRRAAREVHKSVWAALFAKWNGRWSDWPRLQIWLASLRATGALMRIANGNPVQAQELMGQVDLLLAQLPMPALTLAELGTRLTGDAHALDEDEPLGRLGLQAAAAWADCALVDSAEGRRQAWERVGVLVDTVSAPLLVLNLRAAGDADSLPGRLLDLYAAAGEPARLSVRMLLRHPPRFSPRLTGPRVFVCENPSIIAAAADRLGARSAPLVCIEGQPRTAARLVLQALRAAGITLQYHGDFDWPGIAIANLILREYGAEPWRMSALDYRAARPGKPLGDRPVEPTWDCALQEAMLTTNRAVHEEQAMEALLADLSSAT